MHRPTSRLTAATILYAWYAASALAGGVVDNSNPYIKMEVIGQDSFVLNTPSEQIPGFSVRLTNAQGQPLPGLTVSIFTDFYFCMNEEPNCTNPSQDLFGAFAGTGSDEELVTDANGAVGTAAYQGGTVPGGYDVYAGVFSFMSANNAAALHNTMGPGAKFDIQQTFEVAGFPGGYLSGNWFAPSLGGGTGFELEFTDAIDSASGKPIAIAIWFGYAPDGGGQNWIYAQGPYDPAEKVVDLPAILPIGAKFPPAFNSADVDNISWGRLTFTFDDCNNGSVSWTSYLPAYADSPAPLPIARLTKIAGLSCPQ